MAINNTIILEGNMNKIGLRMIETEESTFGSFSLATTDSYKDKETEEWKDKATIWHNVLVFNPKLIELLKGLNSKARIRVIGSISYREFIVVDGNNQEITKREASIIARNIEQAPLVKKQDKDENQKA
ncbi:MAG: single-stranded DNA-binding protein [Bacteroidota bacterium]